MVTIEKKRERGNKEGQHSLGSLSICSRQCVVVTKNRTTGIIVIIVMTERGGGRDTGWVRGAEGWVVMDP